MTHTTRTWLLSLGLTVGLAAGCSHRPPPVTTPPIQVCDARPVPIVVFDGASDRGVPGVTVTGDPAQMGQDQRVRSTDGNGFSSRVACGPADYTFVKDGFVSQTQNLSGRDASGKPFTHRVHLVRAILPHPDPLVGMLRVAPDGQSFIDDTGDRVPVSFHFGDGFWRFIDDEGLTLRALDQIREAGYHVVRSWANLNESRSPGFWGYLTLGPFVTPNYRAHMVAYARALQVRQLKWHLSLGGLKGYSRAQQEDFYRLLAGVIAEVGPDAFVLAGEVNEAKDTTDRATPRDIESLVNIIRSQHTRNLYALSAYTGTEDQDILSSWTPSWMRFFIVHGYRWGHLWDKMRHRFSLLYEGTPVRRLAWETEGVGPGKHLSNTVNGAELLSPGAVPMMSALTAISRTIPTYTSSAGIIFDEPLTNMAGFRTTPALLRHLPRDVMRWSKLFHSGRGAGEDVRVLEAQGDVRIDGAASTDGRRAMVIYGPPGNYTLRAARGFIGEMCRALAETVACDPVSWRAGDGVAVSFTDGRLLVGRVQ